MTGIDNISTKSSLIKNATKAFKGVLNGITKKLSSVFYKPSPSFSIKTNTYNGFSVKHNTNFGNIMSNLIGLHEVQGKAPANITKNNVDLQWCSYTVSYGLEMAVGRSKLSSFGIKSTYPRVQQYIDWAKKSTSKTSQGKVEARYHSIAQQNVSLSTMNKDRKTREAQIKEQLDNKDPKTKIKEGDLIIWKSDYCANVNENGKAVKKSMSSSHIGMIEKVTRDKNGEYNVWVIEGNANEAKSDGKFERYINKTDSIIGAQKAGEIVETNKDDGIIRKCYTVKDLANFGYSGYINMDGIV